MYQKSRNTQLLGNGTYGPTPVVWPMKASVTDSMPAETALTGQKQAFRIFHSQVGFELISYYARYATIFNFIRSHGANISDFC